MNVYKKSKFLPNFCINILILVISCSVKGDKGPDVSAEKTLVWGPGLKQDFVVPVRYFIIQAVNSNGEKYDIFFLKLRNVKLILIIIIYLYA